MKPNTKGSSGPDYIESIFSFLPRHSPVEPYLIQFLKKFGFARSDLAQTQQGKFRQIRVYLENPLHARRLAQAFRQALFQHVHYTQKRLIYKAWAEKWKEDYQIQNLGRSFLIVPSWRKKQFLSLPKTKRIPLFIDPQSVFGSGEHETTQLVVRLMERLRGKFKTFLDIGTGTGILALVAVHCGAEKVSGFDSDKPSAACARFNFKQNGLSDRDADFFCAELARLKAAPRFDLVCANINSHILEKYRRQISNAAKPGGWILVSGILRQTEASFRKEFDGPELKCLKVLRGRRWVAVLYKKIARAAST